MPIQTTRSIIISDKIFTAEDLRRIAKIFEKQKKLFQESEQRYSVSYEIHCADNTKYETESIEIFDDESLAVPARVVKIEMSLRCYSENKYMKLSIHHGERTYGNEIIVSSTDSNWLAEVFMSLKQAADSVAPQKFWFKCHNVIFLVMLAIGIGALYFLIFNIAGDLIIKLCPQLINESQTSVAKVQFPETFIFVCKWAVRIFFGLCGGALFVRDWFLSIWPSIEFDFGLDHLKLEKAKRDRVIAIITLIILPIILSSLQSRIDDLFK